MWCKEALGISEHEMWTENRCAISFPGQSQMPAPRADVSRGPSLVPGTEQMLTRYLWEGSSPTMYDVIFDKVAKWTSQ